jgi:hypothetical protein
MNIFFWKTLSLGLVRLVSANERPLHSFTLAFLHPVATADVRLRITVHNNMEISGLHANLQKLLADLKMRAGYEPFKLSLDYSDTHKIEHSCIRVKDKLVFRRDSIRASLKEYVLDRFGFPA